VPELTAEDVLWEFVEDIDSTGGLGYSYEEKQAAPAADLRWTALAVTYKKACRVLGRKPRWAECDDLDDFEEEEDEC
jgi:hypothetical protein